MTEPAAASPTRPARPRRLRGLSIAFIMAVVALLAVAISSASAAVNTVNLAQYERVARYPLPLPPGTAAPAHSLLAEEASAVTYDPVNEHLYVVGDGGTSVVEVDKQGNLLSSMTLAPGNSPQGTTFYDTEGVAYVGQAPSGEPELVITEERYSNLVRFTYVKEGELTAAEVKKVNIGAVNDNIGIEGVTDDPLHPNTMIAIKESGPERIYPTEIDWAAQTATNYEGQGTGAGEGELFPAADAKTLDFSDVYALANVAGISDTEKENLLIISQESGEVVNISRSGHVNSRLALLAEPSDTISVPDMTNEGVTMDQEGTIYIVDEDGGGSQAHPQMWVYKPATGSDTAPTAVTLGDETSSVVESPTPLTHRLKVASVTVTDPDGFGENNLSVTGADKDDFEVDHNGLYLKAGITLNAASKPSYEVNVAVTDPAFGSEPNAETTSPYTLTVTPAAAGSASDRVAITEVAPWGSGNSPFAADWFELTNTGTSTIDLSGWKADDDHNNPGGSALLEGVPSLDPGQSAVFVQGGASVAAAFDADWFPGGLPAGTQVGYYESADGLSTGGDKVFVYNALNQQKAAVEFGASPGSAPYTSFENPQGLGSGGGSPALLTTMAANGVNGAFTAGSGDEIGSPGTAVVPTPVAITEVAPWGSKWSEYEADWFELTNETDASIELAGWKMDDNSHEFSKAVELSGIDTIAAGESVIFVEAATGATEGEAEEVVEKFETSWFGASVPAGLQVGHYQGSGVGLSEGGDGVNIFNAAGDHITGVGFGASTSGVSFDNAAGLGSFAGEAAISTLSQEGVDGAFNAHDQIGSPGTTQGPPPLPEVKVTEVDPAGSGSSYGTDWFELTNEGTTAVDLSGWRASDSADTTDPGESGELTGVASLPAGASAVFLEKPAKLSEFEATWFPHGVPAGFLIGGYAGAKGLGTSGDQVNIFDASEAKVTGVSFGGAPEPATFDNAAGIGGTTSPPPTISTASVVGVDGGFAAADGEIGSPGTTVSAPVVLPDVRITEVDPTSSSGPVGGDWFELTNEGTTAVDLGGWKMNDSHDSFASGGDLTGVASLPAGASAVFVEDASQLAAFESTWFPAGLPTGYLLGTYGSVGIGLSSSGDAVNIFNAAEEKVTGVAFGASTSGVSFDNAAGIGDTSSSPPTISTLSVLGLHGAFENGAAEIGSPGTVTGFAAELAADTPTFPVQAADTIGEGQWVTITNSGPVPVQGIAVKIVEADAASAGDFILGSDHCTGPLGLAAGASCKVLVRFAPGRENAESSANLVVTSTASDSPLEVRLTGTSTGLPEGPKGEKGDTGDTGATGPQGAVGAKGDTGPKGDTGAKGDKGDAGPQGPAGPRGPQGPAGKNGRDGVVSFTTSEDNAEARRGGVAHLQFKLKNGTVGPLSGARLQAGSLAGNGTSTVKVPTLKAHETRKLSVDLKVGRKATLGRHKVKVQLSVGGHTLTQTAIVTVTR